jgi:hypothetical protein
VRLEQVRAVEAHGVAHLEYPGGDRGWRCLNAS